MTLSPADEGGAGVTITVMSDAGGAARPRRARALGLCPPLRTPHSDVAADGALLLSTKPTEWLLPCVPHPAARAGAPRRRGARRALRRGFPRYRDEDTLIVWNEAPPQGEGGRVMEADGEPEGPRYALSFQIPSSCEEMWVAVCAVMGVDPANPSGQEQGLDDGEERSEERFDPGVDEAEAPELPAELSAATLAQFAAALGEAAEGRRAAFTETPGSDLQRRRFGRFCEVLADQILGRGHVAGLLEQFEMAEDLEDAEALTHAGEAVRALVLLGSKDVLDTLFAGTPEALLKAVGALEYAEGPAKRQQHRQRLCSAGAYRELLPFSDAGLADRIHRVYRVTYVRDAVFGSTLDPMPQQLLNQMVFESSSEVCGTVIKDNAFLDALFARMDAAAAARAGAAGPAEEGFVGPLKLVRELCQLSSVYHAVPKSQVLEMLADRGLLRLVGACLADGDVQVRQLALGLLDEYLNYAIGLLRRRTAQEGEARGQLLGALVRAAAGEAVPALLSQVAVALRRILDTSEPLDSCTAAQKTALLGLFYEAHMDVLMRPLGDCAAAAPCSRAAVERLVYAMDFLAFAVPIHSYHAKNYLLRNSVLQWATALVGSEHMVLALAAARVLRAVVALKNEFYNRHLVKLDAFGPLLQALAANGAKYNMLSSSVLSTLDFIRVENIKSLVEHMAVSQRPHLEALGACGITMGAELLTKHEQNIEARDRDADEPEPDGAAAGVRTGAHRVRRDGSMSREEEDYFDEGDDDGAAAPGHPLSLAAPGGGGREEGMPTTPPVFRKRFNLVADYDEDEDEDDFLGALAKKAKSSA